MTQGTRAVCDGVREGGGGTAFALVLEEGMAYDLGSVAPRRTWSDNALSWIMTARLRAIPKGPKCCYERTCRQQLTA
jgi:hypothetical protein